MEAIKEALLETISCMLSAENEVRHLAEERQKALEVTEDYSIHLAEIILTQDEALEERQMSSVLLKKYIRTHWVSNCNHFVDPVITNAIKNKLRNVLPMGLSDVAPKIQAAVASVLAVIAEYDFPNEWGAMTNIFLTKLISESQIEVLGALLFLDECTKLLALHNLALLAPMVYNILYQIAQNDKYPSYYRSVVINLLPRLLVADRSFNKATRQELVANLDKFVTLFINILNEPYNFESDFLIKGDIIKFIYSVDTLVEELTEKITLKVLPVAWEVLQKCTIEYINVIMELQTYPTDHHEDNDPVNFINLVDNLFTFIKCVLKTVDAGKHFLFKYMPDVLYNIIIFMCITSDMETDWINDYELFYKEDEECDEGNLRTHVKSVLILLLEICPNELLTGSIEGAISKVLDETRGKQNAHLYWWRPQESMMYAVGIISTAIRAPGMFDIKSHMAYWINFLNPQNISSYPFLFARCLWIGGKLSTFLDKDQMILNVSSILDSMITPNPIIQISAVRAMFYHCRQVNHRNTDVFIDHLEIIIERLIIAATQVDILLKITLESITALISFNYLLVPPLLDRILPFLSNVFWKNMTNCVIMSKCNDIIAEFSKNNHCVQYVHSIMLPEILKAITNTYGSAADIYDSQTAGLNALKTIIDYAPLPIDQQLLEHTFMTVYKIILTVKDALVLESAAYCMSTFLLIAPGQIYNIRSTLGESGVDFVVHAIRHMLDPQMPNNICKGVGRLCITTLKCLRNLLFPHHLNCIIKSTLTRMNYLNDVNLEDNLVIIFVYLCYNYMEIFIDTLSLIPGPDGGSALTFIFKKWLNRNFKYQGRYETVLCTVAISKVLENALLKTDEKLLNIMINLDANCIEGINIPLVARIFQLLVQIFIYNIKSESDEYAENDSEYSDNMNDDVYDVFVNLAGQTFLFDEFIFSVNITEYLREFFQMLAQTTHYYTLLNYLSDTQMMELQAAGLTPNN